MPSDADWSSAHCTPQVPKHQHVQRFQFSWLPQKAGHPLSPLSIGSESASGFGARAASMCHAWLRAPTPAIKDAMFWLTSKFWPVSLLGLSCGCHFLAVHAQKIVEHPKRKGSKSKVKKSFNLFCRCQIVCGHLYRCFVLVLQYLSWLSSLAQSGKRQQCNMCNHCLDPGRVQVDPVAVMIELWQRCRQDQLGNTM